MKLKLVLALLSLIALVACGAPTATSAAVAPTTAPAAATTVSSAAATEEATAAATEEATAAATEAPTTAATEAATTAATDAATTEAPAATETSGTATIIDLKTASAATIANTDGWYYQMQSQLGESKKCMEGQGGAAPGSGAVLDGAAFMDNCQNVTGQTWKLVPQQNGYYHLQNQFGEAKNLCLEGNRLVKESLLAGAAVMNACGGVSGQLWKFVDAGNGYYHLQTQFLEGDNKCLDGQDGAAPGSGAVLDGAAFMNDCQDVSGQLWKLTPIDVAVINVPTAAPEATAASEATAAPEATAVPAGAAQPTVDCGKQYTDEIAKFKSDVIAEIARERDEATKLDGIARAPLQWNDQLACQAQEWAQALATNTYRQNPHCCYAQIPVHSDYRTWKLGAPEGIATGPTSAVEGVKAWETGEKSNYDFSASEAAKRKDHTCLRQVCGHYGAVIGLFTTDVGCGFYLDPAGKGENYTVCQYVFKQSQ